MLKNPEMETDTKGKSVITTCQLGLGSGISGSRVPDNCFGYSNPILISGTRNIALWEDLFSNKMNKSLRYFCLS